MPVSLAVGKTAQATWLEWTGPSGTGTNLPPVTAPTFLSDNPTIASVDGNSGLVTAIAPGTANITGTDAGNGLTASDVATVTAATVAASATLTLAAL